ncbi:NAD(P)/FAD-dependent oxidoreductase [Streptosporangium sp. CA-135522]|uniref:NAD(P)/FAD-dependent oxidoreductase n=1 Tax=Streptosporangium sp. CA-135522 TaxID=3240072 RepID=UPI003D93DD6A
MQHFDVAIIGGGPAGLTAAMTLSRSLRRVAVLDARRPPRNIFADEMHGIVGLDGVSPGEYRRRAWADLEKYGMAELHEVTGTDVTPDPEGGFTVTAEEGPPVWARQVLLATGMVDAHPKVEGFGECWGRTVIHCPFCLGWENRDRRWAVVTDDPEFAATAAAVFSAWSDDVIVLANGAMPPGERDGEIIDGEIRRLHHDGGDLRAIELADGTIIERQTMLWQLDQRPVPLISHLAEQLGLAVGRGGYVETDSSFRTNVSGLYATGDLITASQAVVESAAAGSGAAFQIIADARWPLRDVPSGLSR